MKLTTFNIWNYKNIDDTSKIKVDPAVTCFVGKNESGKTAVMQALYRLNPVEDAGFDEILNYPRKGFRKYQRKVKAGEEESAKVITVTFKLEDADVAVITKKYGDCVAVDTILSITKKYDGSTPIDLGIDEQKWVKHYISQNCLEGATIQKARTAKSLDTLIAVLNECSDDTATQTCLGYLNPINEKGIATEIWDQCLKELVPKFFFFDSYKIMKGVAELSKIDDATDDGIKTLKDLLALSGVTPQELMDSANYEHHKAKLEAIANEITDDVFCYWKQNSLLRVEFDVYSSGTFHVRIKNEKHRVTVPFDERSRGFVWFFSFLAEFKKLSQDHKQMVILLDEPGLNLHASAQADLLMFIEKELVPKHQVIYTTHSPFMIDANRFERVRTVEDFDDKGVKVSSECLSIDSNTIFPLQAALGYSLAQTLFVGPNCLLVEGPSDLNYLHVMSDILCDKGCESLSKKWVIIPVGGADKLATFVTLLGANELNVCVLMDISKKDKQRVDNLRQNIFLSSKQIVQLNEFVKGGEADIEDLFSPGEYIALVKKAYPDFTKDLSSDNLGSQPRIVKRVESFFSKNVKGCKFNHFKPSRVGLAELGKSIEISQETVERFESVFKKINGLLPTE